MAFCRFVKLFGIMGKLLSAFVSLMRNKIKRQRTVLSAEPALFGGCGSRNSQSVSFYLAIQTDMVRLGYDGACRSVL